MMTLSTSLCAALLLPLLLKLPEIKSLPLHHLHLFLLFQLSLRNNPLVVRFVRDMQYDPPSLMEMAARTIKINKMCYEESDLPQCLANYLKTAHRCVNPKCKGRKKKSDLGTT